MLYSTRARLGGWTRRAGAAAVIALLALMARPSAQQQTPAQPAGQNGQAQPGSQAQPAAQEPPPVFRGGINFVRVDVIATDGKSQPVLDLKQDEFEVLEDGQLQAVEQFRLIRVDGNPKVGDPPPRVIRNRDDEETEAARDDVRVYAILLDDYHTRRSNSVSVREPLTRFIQTQLRPNDMIAIMYPLTPVADVSFTRDHDAIIRALNQFEGRKYDYRPKNQLEENYARYSTDQVERIRNDVVMGALRGLSVRLGSLREGRKSVIFVSEGFTAILPPQMRREDASSPENPILSAGAAAQQDSPREETAAWFGQSDVNSRLREVFQQANRNNTSIYSLDPRGLTPFEFQIDDTFAAPPSFATDRRVLQMTQDTLRTLAEETDGRAIVNRNTLYEGLTQIVKDSSFYYLLGYSSKAATDGKFHEIRVRVKRRGVETRARRGYWAATAADVQRASAPAKEIAKPVLSALATLSTSIQSKSYIRTWVGTERGANGKTKVTLIWEPAPVPAGARRDAPGGLGVLAATEKGDLVYRGRSALTPATPPSGQASGAALSTGPQRVTFEAAPGKLDLRLTVEGANGAGTLDREDKTVDVPDLTAPQVAISTPRVFRARTARDAQQLAADGNATPVIAREFSRTERLLIRFDLYSAGGDMATASAQLLNRAGQKMSDVPVTAATAGGTHAIDLGLNTIPAGEYLIQIDAKGTSGEAREVLAIRVGA
jgi:VWFA-related protein